MWLCRKYLKSKTPADCDYCNKPEERGERFEDAESKDRAIESTKKLYGCIGRAEHPFKFDDGYQLYTCPNKYESELYQYFRAYSWYDHHGTLPFGELEDQSERLVVAMETIRTEYRKIDKEDSEKLKEKWQKK